MTVYVVQQPRPHDGKWQPDLTPAEKFGNIGYIFDGDDNVYASTTTSLIKAKHRLKKFNAEEDYILWPNMGDSSALVVTCFALSSLGLKEVMFLYWNRKMTNGRRDKSSGFYTPVNFGLN